jgi:hypothetical protein
MFTKFLSAFSLLSSDSIPPLRYSPMLTLPHTAHRTTDALSNQDKKTKRTAAEAHNRSNTHTDAITDIAISRSVEVID